jgi:DNA-binding MarR family transcriptional regulator
MPRKDKESNAAKLFDYFYLVHYQLNMAIEDVMRGNLSRKEAALLLLLYAEGGPSACLPRKMIVNRFASWFDATSSNVTKIIARLASRDFSLVDVSNAPGSERDKQIGLTAKGRDNVRGMLQRGARHSQLLLGGISEEDLAIGLEFFQKASIYTDSLLPLQMLSQERKNRGNTP